MARKGGGGEVDFQSFSQDVHGTLTLAKREFFSNFFSIRLLIIVIIFTLMVMASAWGIGTLGAQEIEIIFPEEELEDKAFLCAFRLDLDANETFDDVLVTSIDHQGNPIPNFFILASGEGIQGFGMASTDADGRILYRNLTEGQYIFQGSGTNFTAQAFIEVTPSSVEAQTYIAPIFDFGKVGVDEILELLSGSQQSVYAGFIVQVVDSGGEPLAGAPIYSNGQLLDETNENGVVWTIDEPNGDYDLEIELNGERGYIGRAKVDIEKEEGPLDMLKGMTPDEVLIIVSGLVSFISSILAVVLAHDAVTRERLGNTMDFLLCRPLGKTSIIVGKFIGITLSLVLPFSIVLIAGTLTIGAISGTNPTPRLVVGFIVLTAIFMAIWILISLILSTLSRTSGTSILSGLGIWFVYTFIWDLIMFLGTSGETSGATTKVDLLNPTRAYLYTLISEAAKMGGFEEGLEEVGLSYGVPHLAMAIWFFGLLFLAIIVFKKKTSE